MDWLAESPELSRNVVHPSSMLRELSIWVYEHCVLQERLTYLYRGIVSLSSTGEGSLAGVESARAACVLDLWLRSVVLLSEAFPGKLTAALSRLLVDPSEQPSGSQAPVKGIFGSLACDDNLWLARPS